MRRRLSAPAIALVALVAVVASLAAPAFAITGGVPDGEDHPSVGVVLFYQPDGRFRCSGTLVTPTVFVTAAHCTFLDIGQVAVSFDTEIALTEDVAEANIPRAVDDSGPADAHSDIGFTPEAFDDLAPDAPDWVLGTPLTHPDYSDFTDLRNWNDTGVVVLDEPISIAPTPLAPANYLDQFAQPRLNHTLFDVVGYGTEVRKNPDGSQQPIPQRYPLIRRFTTAPGQKLTDQILQLNGNINDTRGGGGTCFGDSGGPVLKDGYIVGDTSYGYTNNCRYIDGYQRVDIPIVRDWILCVVASPDAATAETDCGSLG